VNATAEAVVEAIEEAAPAGTHHLPNVVAKVVPLSFCPWN